MKKCRHVWLKEQVKVIQKNNPKPYAINRWYTDNYTIDICFKCNKVKGHKNEKTNLP